MNEQENIIEAYMTEYTENYMDKVFYFCLKKTGNSTEAEDLTSDISLCVFTQLRRGANPEAFSAWVWRIARNRYSKWANAKHIKNDVLTGADIDDLKLAYSCNIENEMVQNEEMSLMRRELAFISSDYITINNQTMFPPEVNMNSIPSCTYYIRLPRRRRGFLY